MTKTQTLAEAFEEICVMDAPLNQRLAAYSDKLRELHFPFAEAYDDLKGRLLAGEVGTMAPAIGEPMPSFILPAKSGRLVSLEDVIAKGPAVISFNRGHWCPLCKIELRTIANHHAELSALGAEVVSIMPDRQKFAATLGADTLGSLQILSDIDNAYALSLGLVIWLGDKIQDLMRGRGLHLDTYQGNEGWFVPVPATFVVGTDGRVAGRLVDPDITKRMDVDEILCALRVAREQARAE